MWYYIYKKTLPNLLWTGIDFLGGKHYKLYWVVHKMCLQAAFVFFKAFKCKLVHVTPTFLLVHLCLLPSLSSNPSQVAEVSTN